MISMISAMDLARNIGYQGDMPWGREMKGDLNRFKALTMGKIIIMGRKTFDSMPMLEGRFHIVISKKKFQVRSPMVRVVNSIEEALEYTPSFMDTEERFVIGGATIYEQMMPYVDRIHITKIHELFEGDTKFPTLTGAWDIVYGPKLQVEGDKYPSTYITYTRRSK